MGWVSVRQDTNGVCAENIVYFFTFLHYMKGILTFRCMRTVSKAKISLKCLSVHMEHLSFHCTDIHVVL